MRSARVFTAAAAVATVIFFASPAAAQNYADVKGMDERFRLDLGGFFQKFDTTIRLDSPTLGIGTEVSLEDLGLKANQTSFRAEGYYRFGRHGGIAFGFLTGSRSGSTTLTKDIQFGDHVYHAGVSASASNRLSQADLYYSYSFVNNGEAEFGLQLGFSALFHDASLSATGNVTGPGGTVVAGVSTDSRSVIAPVPALGGYFRFTLLPRFFVSARAKGLPTITISTYKGSMVDVKGALDYYFSKNVGLGAGYSYTKVTLIRTSTNTLTLKYIYSGPLAYLTLAF